MQNLIKGERYRIKHPQGIWEGEATYTGKDLNFVQLSLFESASPESVKFFKEYPCNLNPQCDWSLELVNINLENV